MNSLSDSLRPENLSLGNKIQAVAIRWNNSGKHPVLGFMGGRLIGVVVKPPARILDVALHLIVGVGKVLVGVVVAPIQFVAFCLDKNFDTNWTVKQGLFHFGYGVLYTFDVFASPVVNLISPNIYDNKLLLEIKNFQNKINSGNQEKKKLNEKIANLEKQLKKKEEVFNKADQANQNKNNELNAQILKLQADLKQEQGKLVQLTQQSDQATNVSQVQINELKSQSQEQQQKLEKTIADLEKQLKEKEEAFNKVESGSNAQILKLQADLKQEQEKLARLQQQPKDKEIQLEKMQVDMEVEIALAKLTSEKQGNSIKGLPQPINATLPKGILDESKRNLIKDDLIEENLLNPEAVTMIDNIISCSLITDSLTVKKQPDLEAVNEVLKDFDQEKEKLNKSIFELNSAVLTEQKQTLKKVSKQIQVKRNHRRFIEMFRDNPIAIGKLYRLITSFVDSLGNTSNQDRKIPLEESQINDHNLFQSTISGYPQLETPEKKSEFLLEKLEYFKCILDELGGIRQKNAQMMREAKKSLDERDIKIYLEGQENQRIKLEEKRKEFLAGLDRYAVKIENKTEQTKWKLFLQKEPYKMTLEAFDQQWQELKVWCEKDKDLSDQKMLEQHARLTTISSTGKRHLNQ